MVVNVKKVETIIAEISNDVFIKKVTSELPWDSGEEFYICENACLEIRRKGYQIKFTREMLVSLMKSIDFLLKTQE